ncbi:Ecp26 [Fulvia fulva]|uniref:Ecp26 n=1 Tax=Passalora fulva TaxID=5499 RepID=A0A1P8YXJ2_PASFU|nr:Ecp26 [Fulvia fulva]AQA29223.1 extracellular protein 26 [Fulvia fulva]KAK4613583.1 Ecp26 [Fulvia fulva]KAK4614385.1 Ecp26 [Fulvia fulva]UJO21680.1 Ecp26 [Fulvia fulva]WPV20791.1 Ecp26 [Fulvia fulva]
MQLSIVLLPLLALFAAASADLDKRQGCHDTCATAREGDECYVTCGSHTGGPYKCVFTQGSLQCLQ